MKFENLDDATQVYNRMCNRDADRDRIITKFDKALSKHIEICGEELYLDIAPECNLLLKFVNELFEIRRSQYVAELKALGVEFDGE